MLNFIRAEDAPVPVHDSFIMHCNSLGELEEEMRRSFCYFKDINVKSEIGVSFHHHLIVKIVMT